MNNRQQGRAPIHESSFKIALAQEYLTGNLGCKTLATGSFSGKDLFAKAKPAGKPAIVPQRG